MSKKLTTLYLLIMFTIVLFCTQILVAQTQSVGKDSSRPNTYSKDLTARIDHGQDQSIIGVDNRDSTRPDRPGKRPDKSVNKQPDTIDDVKTAIEFQETELNPPTYEQAKPIYDIIQGNGLLNGVIKQSINKPEIIKPTTEITETKNNNQPADNATIVVMDPVREYIIKDKGLENEDKGLENAKADSPVPELEEKTRLKPPIFEHAERINDEIRSVTPTVRQSQESEVTRPWGNVKSTRIYEGGPSQEHMANQGKSIEEIKGPDLSIGTTQSQYRTAPISSWSVQDYIDVTKPKFRNALLNRDLYTKKAPKNTRPRVVITAGEKQNETRTTPIKDWTRDQYLNITPAEKHNALNNMQKRPTITGGVEENKEERTKSIKDS